MPGGSSGWGWTVPGGWSTDGWWLWAWGLLTNVFLKRSRTTANQTRRARQGLEAPFVSSSTEVAKVICSVRLSPFVSTVQCKSISPEMENSDTAGAADLWGNGNQSQPHCNLKCFLACTSPAEFPLIQTALSILRQTIGVTTACCPWLTFETSHFRDGVPGSPDRSTPSTIHLIWQSPVQLIKQCPFLIYRAQCCCRCHMLTITL